MGFSRKNRVDPVVGGEEVAADGVAAGAANEAPEPMVDAASPARLSKGQVVVVALVSSLIASLLGGTSGYYFASRAPVAPQIAVFDVEGTTQLAVIAQEKTGVDAKVFADKVSEKMRARLKKLSDLGVVVVDKASTVGFPNEVLIDGSDIIAEVALELGGGSKSDGKPSGSAFNNVLREK